MSWETVAWRARATCSSVQAGAWRHTAAAWSSDSSPAARAWWVAGSSPSLRAMARSRLALPAETPHFHAIHCSGERMPHPSHAPVSSTRAISSTSRPVAALSVPHTSAIDSSSRAASASRSSTVTAIERMVANVRSSSKTNRRLCIFFGNRRTHRHRHQSVFLQLRGATGARYKSTGCARLSRSRMRPIVGMEAVLFSRAGVNSSVPPADRRRR